MKILFIGDVFGSLGIKAIEKELPSIKKQYNIDITIANAENVSECRGLNISDYNKLVELGIDYFTFGNHTWKQQDYDKMLSLKNVVRPLNMSSNSDFAKFGVGTLVINFQNKKIRITNILGLSVYFKKSECINNPFICLENLLLEESKQKSDIHIVDYHAETTSEKNAIIRHFNGKIDAIIGTHTHVQTNDARIINNTAYITDVGMTGPCDGVIGADGKEIIKMFLEKKAFFKLQEAKGKYQFCAVVLEFDQNNNIKEINKIFIFEK